MTVAAVASASATRATAKGAKYTTLTLSDLSGAEARLMLFQQAYSAHFRLRVGRVVAVLNPRVLPDTGAEPRGPGRRPPPPACAVDHAEQLCVLGAVAACPAVPCASLMSRPLPSYQARRRNWGTARALAATGSSAP